MNLIYVALGAALGGLARYALGLCANQLLGERFPYGTLVANGLGCLILGLVFGLGLSGGALGGLVVFGFCGGLTTFSSFSLQSLTLVSERRWLAVGANLLVGLLLCVALIYLGMLIGERVSG